MDGNTAPIGHNNPPDPLDEALAPYCDAISEAENWLDGTKVENEDQMKAVDAILKDVKAADKALGDARDTATKPLHEVWKAEVARWKPTVDDLARIKKGLAALVSDFKNKLAQEKARAEAAARAEAEKARREAERQAQEAAEGDIESQRKAAEAAEAAQLAQAQAVAASKDKVKGLRTVTKYEVTDHRVLLHWIAKNDRDAITAFVDEYARRNHKQLEAADGLRVWTEKVAI